MGRRVAYTQTRPDLQRSSLLEGLIELFEQPLLLSRELLGHFDLDDADQVAPPAAVEPGHASAANHDGLPILDARGHLDRLDGIFVLFEGGDLELRPERGLLLLPFRFPRVGIEIERDLLTVDGQLRRPKDVYRKVLPRKDD